MNVWETFTPVHRQPVDRVRMNGVENFTSALLQAAVIVVAMVRSIAMKATGSISGAFRLCPGCFFAAPHKPTPSSPGLSSGR